MASSLLVGNCILPPSTVSINIGRSRNYCFSRPVAISISARRSSSRRICVSAISTVDSSSSSNDASHLVFEHDSPISKSSSSTLPSRVSPWLMLPPAFEDDKMVYKFYSLKDDKVLSINKRSGDGEPADECEFKGSSHGWLVLYNPRNLDLFLSNPLTGRHIKLPPIRDLPGIPKPNLEGGYGCVDTVILSSHPDDQDCRAVMIYAPSARLAFCCPGHTNTQWTPISRHNYGHQSCVYSTTQKLFFSLNCHFHFQGMDIVTNPFSPRSFVMDSPYFDEDHLPWSISPEEKWNAVHTITYNMSLVIAEPGDLLLVCRHTMSEMYPDGSSATVPELDDYNFDANGMRYPYKTINFTVHKYDPKEEMFEYMNGSLDGMAIFIGQNHSFVMTASDCPELKPDSIYFADIPVLIASDYGPETCNFGGHDIGIYNYKDKTISSCYYPCDVQSLKRIEPAPMWFTPSPL